MGLTNNTGKLSNTLTSNGTQITLGGSTVTDGNLLNIIGNQSSVNVGVVFNNTNGTYPKIYGLTNVNNNFVLYDYSSSATRLTISTTGAATFSSSISATSATFSDLVTTTSVYRIVQASASRGGLYTYNQVAGSGTDYSLGIASEGEAFITTGGTATKRLTIASTGAATFSSTAADYGLSITNVQDASQGLLVRATDNDTSLYLLNLQSSNGATSQTWVDRFAVTKGGNVGIGTGSPTCTLEVARNNGGSTGGQIALRNSSSSTLNSTTEISFLNDTGASASGTRNGRIISQMENVANGASNMQFWTWSGSTDAERMRITSDGKSLFGTSTAGYGLFSTQRVTINPISDGVVVGPLPQNNSAYTTQGSDNSGTRYALYIANGSSSAVGNISFTSSSTSYNTSSDYRLKEDLKDINGLEKLSAIKVYDFKWKNSEDRMDGVLAHELAEVIPYAVNGEKDGEQMQGVDYSKLVPVLVKAIQEQNEIITKQGQAIEELKALINK